MSDGPNYEALFLAMCPLNGTHNLEDRAVIKRYLRFYQGSTAFDTFFAHYGPQLPEEERAEFLKAPVVVEPVVAPIIEETVVEPVVEEAPVVEPVVETTTDETIEETVVATPKPRGRPAKA